MGFAELLQRPASELREAIECPPGLKAEGSGVDSELGGGSGLERPRRYGPPAQLGLSPEDLGFAEQQEPGDREATQFGQVARPFPGNTVLGATHACPRQTVL